MDPKVSVIVPVYNTEPYLRQCLDSIISQTLTDTEIICVDDGSTDESLNILGEYASKDTRIRILQQENKGGGAARNLGMSVAKGKYLSFLDSDDFFDPNMLKLAYECSEINKSDVTIFMYKVYNNSTGRYSKSTHGIKPYYLPSTVIYHTPIFFHIFLRLWIQIPGINCIYVNLYWHRI